MASQGVTSTNERTYTENVDSLREQIAELERKLRELQEYDGANAVENA